MPVFWIRRLFSERIKLPTSSTQTDSRSSEEADAASLDFLKQNMPLVLQNYYKSDKDIVCIYI